MTIPVSYTHLGVLTNDNSGPAPDHCGGSKTVTFTVNSDCEPNVTCTATFTVTPAPVSYTHLDVYKRQQLPQHL